MDYKRLFLLFGLGLVCLWLWQAWEKEYVINVSNAPANNTTLNANSDVPNVPTDASAPTANTVAVADTTVSQVPATRLITVNTDTLNIQIDTLGGNIVSATLPKFPESESQPNTPVVLLNNNSNSLYVAQSGLLSTNGPDTAEGQAQYHTSQNQYKLADGQNELTVDLTWKNAQGIHVIKRFTFKRGDYALTVDYQINNQSQHAWAGRSYYQLKRKEVEQETSLFQIGTYTGAALSTPQQHYEKVTFDDMHSSNVNLNAQGGWVAMLQHYFTTAWVPDQTQMNHFYTRSSSDGSAIIGQMGPTITVAPGASSTIASTFYVGPGNAERLEALAPYLDLTVDYGWLWFISLALFWFMKQIYAVLHNWGWSIVFVTLFIKILFYKLSATSYRSMAGMRRLQPKMQQLKERCGDDRAKFSQAMMELYRKEKVNPLSGCLPILVQIPVFIALYWVLIESVELRQAPFIFWIHDLSAKDPYYILPLLMGLSMFVQQKLNPTPPDPIQAKVMMLLPFIFTVFFLNFPAGLVLYWTVNNGLSILQQWYIMRKVEAQHQQKKQEKSPKLLKNKK